MKAIKSAPFDTMMVAVGSVIRPKDWRFIQNAVECGHEIWIFARTLPDGKYKVSWGIVKD